MSGVSVPPTRGVAQLIRNDIRRLCRLDGNRSRFTLRTRSLPFLVSIIAIACMDPAEPRPSDHTFVAEYEGDPLQVSRRLLDLGVNSLVLVSKSHEVVFRFTDDNDELATISALTTITDAGPAPNPVVSYFIELTAPPTASDLEHLASLGIEAPTPGLGNLVVGEGLLEHADRIADWGSVVRLDIAAELWVLL